MRKTISYALSLLLLFAALPASPTLAYTAPVATSFSTTVSTVGATAIQLQGSDAEGTPLVFAVTAGPSHGTLSGLNSATGAVVYTPAPGYLGADSFTYTVTSGGETSAAATCSITVTNAKTRVRGRLTNPDGTARKGKVTWVLTQQVTGPDGLIPLSSTVSAALDASGYYDVYLYPSRSLSPQSYYQLKFAPDGTANTENLGLYDIPASAVTITPDAYRVTDTNLANRFVFAPLSAVQGLTQTVSAATLATLSSSNVTTALGYTPEQPLTFGAPLARAGSTVSLASSGVTPGTYSFADVTVDAMGRVTSAKAGTPVVGTGERSLATAAASSGTLLTYTVTAPAEPLAAASVQMENGVQASGDLVCTLRVNGTDRATITVPGYGAEANDDYFKQYDVGRRWIVAAPERLKAGDVVTVVLTSGTVPSSTKLRATLWAELPRRPLASARTLEWFRPHRVQGPLSKDTFPAQPTRITTGTGVDFDPKAAPQNNSGVAKDASNGKLYQFTAFYARDEQHGGGLAGSSARIYGFRSKAYSYVAGADTFGFQFSDNFARADAADVGNNWSELGSPFVTAVDSVSSGALALGGGTGAALVRGEAAVADGVSSVKVTSMAAGSGGPALIARASASADRYYFFVNPATTGAGCLYRRSGGVSAQVATCARAAVVGDTMTLRVVGGLVTGTITPASGPDVQIVSYADGSPLAAGAWGLGKDTRNVTLDDFSLKELTVASGATVTDTTTLDWEAMNAGDPVVDVVPGGDQSSYVGDPQVFTTLAGTAGLVYDTGDGVDLANVATLAVKVRTASSFEGIGAASAFTIYSKAKLSGVTIYCPRIVARAATNDYLLVVGYTDGVIRGFKAFVLPNLTTALTDSDWNAAPVILKNNDEGGSIIARAGRAYLSTWQIPSNNSPAAVQRVYSAPLSDALNPGAWVTEPNSWWHADVSDPWKDGGFTADSVALGLDPDTDELYVTGVVWSVTHSLNSVVWSRRRWDDVFSPAAEATLSAPRGMSRVSAPVEVPVGSKAGVRVRARAEHLVGSLAGTGVVIGPDPTGASLLTGGQLLFWVEPTGASIYTTNSAGTITQALWTPALKLTAGTEYDLTLQRDGATYTAYSSGVQVFKYTVTDSTLLTALNSSAARWKVAAGEGVKLRLLDLTLTHE